MPAPERDARSSRDERRPGSALGAVPPGWRLAALVVAVGGVFALLALSGSLSEGRVRHWGEGFGPFGPWVFVAISAALTVALFPGPLLAAASGLLFGVAVGTPVSIAAAVLGAVAAFGLARGVAGDAVAELGGARLQAVSAWIGKRDFLSVLYARLAPMAPYSLVNYAAGLAEVRLWAFSLATLLGVAPRAFAYTALGGNLSNLDSPEALIAVGVLVAEGALGLWLGWRSARRGRN
jgi:uncharacterized membrane protein YdjX (TVP38/TMEM64 family)